MSLFLQAKEPECFGGLQLIWLPSFAAQACQTCTLQSSGVNISESWCVILLSWEKIPYSAKNTFSTTSLFPALKLPRLPSIPIIVKSISLPPSQSHHVLRKTRSYPRLNQTITMLSAAELHQPKDCFCLGWRCFSLKYRFSNTHQFGSH